MIKEILKNQKEEKINIKGWVVSNRGNDKVRFLTISDGSTNQNLQVVIKNNSNEISEARVGAVVGVVGEIKLTPEAKQPLEVVASSVELLKNTDEDYPIQKQNMLMETLRDLPHLRHRTNTLKSVMRIRSVLANKIHEFFNKENFLWLASPILTGNDGEGAGETFVVDDDEGSNFFNNKATLSVTGQLHAEAYANGFGKVYTFGPTFRAEKSHTQKHLAEFWMVEPEVAFHDINMSIDLASKLLKYTIKETIKEVSSEFDYLDEKFGGLLEKLNNFLSSDVKIMDYKDVLKELEKVKDRFDNKNIEFGIDLATEHEKYIAEEVVKGPVFVVNYPKNIKAFYMYQNPDNETVAAFDLLVPGIGELLGGSQRECDYEKLLNRIKEVGIDQSDMQWYLDLRRFGHYQSSGFGLGFERLVMYVTGVENIKETIPFPRTPKNMKM